MHYPKISSEERLFQKQHQRVKTARAESIFHQGVLNLASLLGVLFLLATLSIITPPAHGQVEQVKSQCYAGQYILHRSLAPAKHEKALGTFASLSSDPLELREESKKAALVEEKSYSGNYPPGSKHLSDCHAEDLCDKLRKHQRSLRRDSKQQGTFSIVRRLECSPNYVLRVLKTPDDYFFDDLWGLNQTSDIDMDLPEAWDLSTGSSDVVVAVIDTGIDYTHEDLKDNMWENPGETAGNYKDDDGNGYIDDVYGIDAITDSGDPMDDGGHGTHCAGTIGAAGNNSKGVTGINWNVKLVAARFIDASGTGSTFDAIEAIEYVTALKNSGVNLVLSNNSWGGPDYSSLLKSAIQDNKNSGMLFITAAGNEGANNDTTSSYPANYDVDTIISVAALDSDGSLAYYSNYGSSSVDIAAPGSAIGSTYPGNKYYYMSGTSMAAPHISGALALLASYSSGLSWESMKSSLLSTAEKMGSLTGYVSSGAMANAYNLLKDASAVSPTPTATSTASPTPTSGGGTVPTATPTPPVNPILSGMLTKRNGSALSGRTFKKIKRLAKRSKIKLVLTNTSGGKTRSALPSSLNYELEVASGEYILALKVPRTKVKVYAPKRYSITANESLSGLNFGVKLK